MVSPFVKKLKFGAHLLDEDCAVLETVCKNTRQVLARTEIISEGDEPSNVHLILEGYACRFKILPDGKRQIMAYFLPGDICDLHIQILRQMDHCIGTLTDCQVVDLLPHQIEKLTANPRINRALWWSTLVDEGTLREWLVNMGQRPAEQQMAHLFCELVTRLQAVGRAQDASFAMPFTQEELADTLGITSVHTNRVMMQLRNRGLIHVKGRTVTIPDLPRLWEFSSFDPLYLHLGQPRGTAPPERQAIL